MSTKQGVTSIGKSSGTLPEAQIKRCLAQGESITGQYLQESLPAFWQAWVDSVEKRIEAARSNKEQVALAELGKLLQTRGPECLRQFQQYIRQGFAEFAKCELSVVSGQERFSQNMGLSLVDNSELEETIAITSISHRADSQFAEDLWALHQRLSLLHDGKKVDERSNPVSPIQLCDSLRRVLGELHLDVRTKVLGYKQFEQAVIKPVAALYQNINDALVAEGILPNLRYSAGGIGAQQGSEVPEATGADAAPRAPSSAEPEADPATPRRRATDKLFEPSASGDPQQYQQGLVSAIRLLQTHLGGAASNGALAAGAVAGGGVPPRGAGRASADTAEADAASAPVVGAIQLLQAQVSSDTQSLRQSEPETIEPQPVNAVTQQLEAELKEQGADNLHAEDMNTIELVGLVFAYILNDEQLPDSVKALLSYLHTPVLKLAFIDPGFFDDVDHPARLLLNEMAEAGSRWVSNDGSSQYNIFEKIKTTVFDVLSNFENDIKIFAEARIEFSSYARNVSRRQELMEKRALEKARGEERLREAKIKVNSDVSACIDGKDLPSPILLLLLLPWSDYLSFIILRYGAESGSYQKALAVARDVLWSVEPKLLEADRKRQLEIQADMLHTLQAGFETIGYEQSKARKLLDAVSSLQRLALKSQAPEPAPETMRQKLEKMAADKAGQVKQDDQEMTSEEQQLMEKLKLMEFGTWLESDTGQRMKVAWYNPKTLHYMLVDQQGRKLSMSSAKVLARSMVTGQLRVIAGSAKPFFERALENIYQSLNAKASGELLERE
jgi:hypothetical protein